MNQDKSGDGLIRRRKAYALAAFHLSAPNIKPSINSESVRITQRLVCCQPSCTSPGDFGTITWSELSGGAYVINGTNYRIRYKVNWTAVSNATSYTFIFSSSPDDHTVVFLDDTSAYIYTNNLADFTMTAVNTCGSSASSLQDAPCFLSGSRVSMADGSTKTIENVAVGDKVIGAFGEENVVLALHRPLLGFKQMCRINDDHSTTAHHPHISVDKQFYCMDPYTLDEETYGKTHKVLNGAGELVDRFLSGLKKGRTQQLVLGVELKTIEGSRAVTGTEIYSLPPETQLYNLVVGGSHTYHVDGYAVTGWPSEQDFDYDAWSPKIA